MQFESGARRARQRYLFLSCAVVGLLAGCASQATWQRETPTGGFITYPIASDADILSSTARRDAITLMEQKCRAGSRILREGEIARVRADIDRTWNAQMSGHRLWGIEFTCN
jgi:hypothetical protein